MRNAAIVSIDDGHCLKFPSFRFVNRHQLYALGWPGKYPQILDRQNFPLITFHNIRDHDLG